MPENTMGLSGRIAAFFQAAKITPLLALTALLLGLFAILATSREEEPQIAVTMANVMVAFPGASAQEVENKVAIPAEQVLGQMVGVEHVMSMSRPGIAILTIQFKVGVSRDTALVRLHDKVAQYKEWMPSQLGVMEPIVKAKGIDDVPIVNLTLWSKNAQLGSPELDSVAHTLEAEFKRVKGSGIIKTIGSTGRAFKIELNPAKLQAFQITVNDLARHLQSQHFAMPTGEKLEHNQSIWVESGEFISDIGNLGDVVVGTRNGQVIYLKDVAQLSEGELPIQQYVWHGMKYHGQFSEYPAVTLSVTKKEGENAVDVAENIIAKVEAMKNSLIPHDVEVSITRNYGQTADEKAKKLIQKLLFATLSVIALVYLALGKREAAIVGVAVALTLLATLFASWAWGFTLNRVSLFALIFSIGILVDDAIVVVENIHRHQQLFPHKAFVELIPQAVDEVGGPTILATLTVIAALLPMAFVSGLMGPYMSPIPINASMGMLISLAIAFILTPYLARVWMKSHSNSEKQAEHGNTDTSNQENLIQKRITSLFYRIFTPLLDDAQGHQQRRKLAWGVLLLIMLSVALPIIGWVQLKMLPFDNKSEFQIVVDAPSGTSLEKTAAAMREMGAYLQTVPEVDNYQAYVGTASPINFNGLVRQYDLRQGGEVGDMVVNLVHQSERHDKSHFIAMRVRSELQKRAKQIDPMINVKIVEVPPGPPVLAPIVAEIYGTDEASRLQVAQQVRKVFEKTSSMVDIDDFSGLQNQGYSEKMIARIQYDKAGQLGVMPQEIVQTLRAGLAGQIAGFAHNKSIYPTPLFLHIPIENQEGLHNVLNLNVRSQTGKLIALSELVQIEKQHRDLPRFRKDGLSLQMVTADVADIKTGLDSPLYAMFASRSELHKIITPNKEPIQEYFINMPENTYQSFDLKWDGEWKITYETFRDMGLAYAVGLVFIYLLVVAHFGSYVTPLIIMAPIPLTIIGVMPGHALLGSQFTATSMIGMIALAGVIVRNSILLVDFIRLQVEGGVAFKEAVMQSAITRAKPIALTGLAAMLGAFFILDDPIFNGLAISLIFGILISTLLTLVIIPILYYAVFKNQHA